MGSAKTATQSNAASKITTEIVKITPEMATEWLGDNLNNRPQRDRRVQMYVRDMQNGAWRLNGDAIRFSETGRLLDGQHRLKAIELSGVTIESVVIRGLPDEAQATMDRGAARGMADQLHLSGEKNATVLAALARRIVLWEAGFIIRTKLTPTEAEMQDVINRHANIRHCTVYGANHRGDMRDVLPASHVAFGLWLLTQCGGEQATFFFNRLSDGIELEEGSPIIALRRRLRKEHSIVGKYVNPNLNLALMVWAWNAYCRKRTLTGMQVNPDALTDENFPMPVYYDQPYKTLPRP